MIKSLPLRSPLLLVLLASIVALGPLSTDFYLPALPAIKHYFHTTVGQIQLTLSGFMASFAIFNLLCGPLSDRFGRKPVLICGMLLFAAASWGCAQATSINELLLFRCLQGIGACCGPVLGRAIIRDIYAPEESAQVLAYLAMMMSLAPAIAPLLGGMILLFSSWQMIFIVLLIYGLFCTASIGFLVPESAVHRQAFRATVIASNYLQLLESKKYLCYCLIIAAIFSGTFAFISVGSFILIELMGVKPSVFGLYFLFIVAGYLIGNGLVVKLSHRIAAKNQLALAIVLTVTAGVLMTLLLVFGYVMPLAIMLPMTLHSIGLGLSLPLCTTAALKPFAQMAGTASALLGFLQMAIPAMIVLPLGHILGDHPLPLALTILIMSLLGALVFFTVCHLEKQTQ